MFVTYAIVLLQEKTTWKPIGAFTQAKNPMVANFVATDQPNPII